MLAKSSVTTILPVMDMDRARHFYEDSLGLQPLGSLPDGQFRYACGTSMLALLPRPESTPSEHTALSFEVANIEAEIMELESHGVRFEDYDLPALKTVDHICLLGTEKAAWFKDSEGNYLCLHETVH